MLKSKYIQFFFYKIHLHSLVPISNVFYKIKPNILVKNINNVKPNKIQQYTYILIITYIYFLGR